MKKHKFTKKPQVRKRQKNTTGELQFTDVVYLEKEQVVDYENPGQFETVIYGVCTCDQWRSSHLATTITKVGLEAKEHVLASGGKCSFRKHPIPEDMKDIRKEEEMVAKIQEELELHDGVAGETSTQIDP